MVALTTADMNRILMVAVVVIVIALSVIIVKKSKSQEKPGVLDATTGKPPVATGGTERPQPSRPGNSILR